MTYVALLRGINVGGNQKVNMKQLKSTFESVGMSEVRTYINSGNVLFESPQLDTKKLTKFLETTVFETFHLQISIIIRTAKEIAAIASALPANWANDTQMKCDVLFLSGHIDNPDVLNKLPKPIPSEDILYIPGCVIWRIDRTLVTKSKMLKIVGTDVYKKMTVRNCNTVRKIAKLL